MKIYLTLQGSDLYRDDPNVQKLLRLSAEKQHTHTPSKMGDDRVVDVLEERVNEIIEDKFEKLVEKLDKIEKKVNGSDTKTGSLSEFKKQFRAEYGDHVQVSRRDISHFIMNRYGVHDSRSIKNRIDFLVAQDVIEPFAPNVYNIAQL